MQIAIGYHGVRSVSAFQQLWGFRLKRVCTVSQSGLRQDSKVGLELRVSWFAHRSLLELHDANTDLHARMLCVLVC